MPITISSIPDIHLSQVELWVRPEEYRAYKSQDYASKLKEIHVWPEHIDCAFKKRKWFCENVGQSDDFMMLDDDVRLSAWSVKQNRYLPAKTNPKLFDRYFSDVFPNLFSKYQHVAAANKFMANPYINEKGLLKERAVGPVVWGFAKGATSHVKHNRVFGYADMYIPYQVFKKYNGNTVVHYGICFGHDNRPELRTTGIHYRSPLIMVDTIMKLAHYMPGVVTGYRMTGKDEDRWLMIKHMSRVLKGVTPANLQASKTFIDEECVKRGLSRAPDKYVYDDETPRDEIIARIRANWKAVKLP